MTIQLGRVGTHRYLEETSAELVSEGLALLLGYHSLLHVALVADHNHGHLSFDVKGEKDLMLNDARMTTSAENSHLSIGVNAEDLFADLAKLLQSLVIDDAVDEQESITSVHESLAKGSIRILTSGIENLNLHGLALDINSRLVRLLNSGIVLKKHRQTSLSNYC